MIANQMTFVIMGWLQTMFFWHEQISLKSDISASAAYFSSPAFPKALIVSPLPPPMMRCRKEARELRCWALILTDDCCKWKSIDIEELQMSAVRSEINPLWLGSFGLQSWHVIHHTKPTQGGYLEVKGFQDPSMYSWEKYHFTIQSNFWTHCT